MEPAKVFNNVIIGQFALTGVPVKVYVDNRYLTITDPDDVENPLIGFGMDEDGEMHRFDYRNVTHLGVSGNEVNLDTYNKGMEAKFKGGDEDKEAPKEDEPKDDKTEDENMDDALEKTESTMKLSDLIREISQEEVDAEIEGAEAQIDAAKAKFKASQAAMKDTIKTSKDKIKAAKANLKVATETYTAGVDDGEAGKSLEEDKGYTFGRGDIVKNKNTKCPHHGSMGIIDKVMDLPDYVGKVAVYTVTNNGDNYKAGDKLTKTVDQLEPVEDEM